MKGKEELAGGRGGKESSAGRESMSLKDGAVCAEVRHPGSPNWGLRMINSGCP